MHLLLMVRVVEHIEVAELPSLQSRVENPAVDGQIRRQMLDQANRETARQVAQHRVPFLCQEQPAVRRADGGAPLHLGGQHLGRVVGEQHQAALEMFVQRGGTGERAEREPLALGRRHDQQLGVSSLGIGGEDSRDPPPRHGLAEDEEAVVQIKLEVASAHERNVPHAVAFVGIEFAALQLLGDGGGLGRRRRRRERVQRQQRGQGKESETGPHAFSMSQLRQKPRRVRGQHQGGHQQPAGARP